MKDFLIPLGISFITGTILGLEREMSHKPAGLRTQVLVNLGTTLFILAGQLSGNEVARFAASVLAGLGFLGAGVIWQQKGNVRGLTTAALIWVNGSLGVVIGLGEYRMAILGVILALVALKLLGYVESIIKSKCHVRQYSVMAKENENVVSIIHEALKKCHYQDEPLTFQKTETGIEMNFSFCNPPVRHQEFIEKLRGMHDVMGIKVK